MDATFKLAASQGTPLFPVSPERANRQHLPLSPSRQSDLFLQNDTFKSHNSRNSSDVQGKVAQFNSLSKEASQRRKDNEAALKRAVVGREEAESETKRLKEENGLLRKEIEDGSARERKVAERMEAVMEDMQRLKETQAHSQTLYEKEVRRARKEAFKSASTLVKLQEELKNTRNKFTLVREDLEIQKRKVENREQEAFAAQYQLVGVQEELEEMKQQIKLVEEERLALKTSLKEEEVARVAAEGKLPLPDPAEPDEFSSPKKPRRDSEKENIDPVVSIEELEEDETSRLKEELRREKRWRIRALDLIDFMKVECQLKRCSCQIAQRQENTHKSDNIVEAKFTETETTTNSTSKSEVAMSPMDTQDRKATGSNDGQAIDSEPLIEFSPSTGTFRTIPSPSHAPTIPIPTLSRSASEDLVTLAPPLHPLALSESPSLLSLNNAPTTTTSTSPITTSPPTTSPPTPITNLPTVYYPPSNPFPITPFRPHTSRILSTTTTTTIPLADPFSPERSDRPYDGEMPYSPACTMTREQALEQIRQRRGRARSIAAGNGTPMKRVLDGRRDVSAPTVGARGG